MRASYNVDIRRILERINHLNIHSTANEDIRRGWNHAIEIMLQEALLEDGIDYTWDFIEEPVKDTNRVVYKLLEK